MVSNYEEFEAIITVDHYCADCGSRLKVEEKVTKGGGYYQTKIIPCEKCCKKNPDREIVIEAMGCESETIKW